ncbi:NUDIX hydrolase [Cupriavidus sp. H18C2]|uniref:NUDIX hydrolase n=1 Tax=Cupriavidus sp. H18C2 TaxID=3241602 RepID=UPI003BF85273
MRPKIRATIVCVRGGRVLLVSKDGTRWALPGGRPNPKEVLADTAAREMLEETALKVKKLVFMSQFLGATTVHHVFLAAVSKSIEPRPCNEIKACRWFALDELDQLNISLTTKRIVSEALAV